jgi:hypothetical protein
MPPRRIPLLIRALALFIASVPVARAGAAGGVETRTLASLPPRETGAPAQAPLVLHARGVTAFAAVSLAAAEPVLTQVVRSAGKARPQLEIRGGAQSRAMEATAGRPLQAVAALLTAICCLMLGGLGNQSLLPFGFAHPRKTRRSSATLKVRSPCIPALYAGRARLYIGTNPAF